VADSLTAATQTGLTKKVLFGMALRQTTGFVESMLRLIGLDWAVPDLGTLSWRWKTLKVNIAATTAREPGKRPQLRPDKTCEPPAQRASIVPTDNPRRRSL
jgi:hypothetical protein